MVTKLLLDVINLSECRRLFIIRYFNQGAQVFWTQRNVNGESLIPLYLFLVSKDLMRHNGSEEWELLVVILFQLFDIRNYTEVHGFCDLNNKVSNTLLLDLSFLLRLSVECALWFRRGPIELLSWFNLLKWSFHFKIYLSKKCANLFIFQKGFVVMLSFHIHVNT